MAHQDTKRHTIGVSRIRGIECIVALISKRAVDIRRVLVVESAWCLLRRPADELIVKFATYFGGSEDNSMSQTPITENHVIYGFYLPS